MSEQTPEQAPQTAAEVMDGLLRGQDTSELHRTEAVEQALALRQSYQEHVTEVLGDRALTREAKQERLDQAAMLVNVHLRTLAAEHHQELAERRAGAERRAFGPPADSAGQRWRDHLELTRRVAGLDTRQASQLYAVAVANQDEVMVRALASVGRTAGWADVVRGYLATHAEAREAVAELAGLDDRQARMEAGLLFAGVTPRRVPPGPEDARVGRPGFERPGPPMVGWRSGDDTAAG